MDDCVAALTVDSNILNHTRLVIPVLNSLLIVYFLVSMGYFWSRRAEEPIRSRRPWMVILHVFSMFAAAMHRSVARELQPEVPCWIELSTILLFLSLINTTFIARSLMLYTDFIANQHCSSLVGNSLKSLQMSSSSGSLPLPWYLKYRWIQHARYFWRIIIFLSFLETISMVSIVYVVKPCLLSVFTVQDKCFANFSEGGFIIALAIFGNLVVYAIIVFKLRKVRENIGVRKEILHLLLAQMVIFALQLINLIGQRNPEFVLAQLVGIYVYQTFEWSIALVFIIYIAFIEPVLQVEKYRQRHLEEHRKEDKVDFISNRDINDEFNFVMADEDCFALFKEFLTSELSVENLLFYIDVHSFKRGIITARTVYETYISETSPFMVNLSAKVRRELEAFFLKSGELRQAHSLPCPQDRDLGKSSALLDIGVRSSDSTYLLGSGAYGEVKKSRESLEIEVKQSVPEGIFDSALSEIWNLMKRDPFMRFRMTPDFNSRYQHYLQSKTSCGILL